MAYNNAGTLGRPQKNSCKRTTEQLLHYNIKFESFNSKLPSLRNKRKDYFEEQNSQSVS